MLFIYYPMVIQALTIGYFNEMLVNNKFIITFAEIKHDNMNRVEEHINAIVKCNDPKEKARMFNELQDLMAEGGEEVAQEYLEGLDNLQKRVNEEFLKQNLEFIRKSMNLTFIAKEYFGKSHAWLSQRINGNLVNGKPAHFTEEELKHLKLTLNEISTRIRLVSETL